MKCENTFEDRFREHLQRKIRQYESQIASGKMKPQKKERRELEVIKLKKLYVSDFLDVSAMIGDVQA